jgi:HSP20 family molecular chaperone IbpA
MKKISILFLVFAAITSQVAYAEVKTPEKKQTIKNFPNDVFAEMEAMEKQLSEALENQQKMMRKMFEEAKNMQFGGKTGGVSLANYQDENFYTYELNFSSFKKEDILVNVTERILTISAENENVSTDKKKVEMQLSNNFFYSMTIPTDADAEPQIKREEGKIIVKFKKVQKSVEYKLEKKAEGKKEKK